jgi:hypothetical protein
MSVQRSSLRNIEIRVSHVVEKVCEAAQNDTGHDFDNLAIVETGITHGGKLLIADLASGFQNIIGKCQSRFCSAIF